MKSFFVLFFFSLFAVASAQKEIFDIAAYQPPRGWQRETKEMYVSFTTTSASDKSWAKVALYKSTPSKGSVEQDFPNEWQDLIVRPFQVKEPPQTIPVKESSGWRIESGSGKFRFNNADVAVNLTTTSGFGKCFSVVTLLTHEKYLKDIENFMASLTLNSSQGTNSPITPPAETKPVNAIPSANTASGALTSVSAAFTTTHFDDGWTSVAREDWVEVTKANQRVLLHYPTNRIDVSSMDYKTIGSNAWNTLVAPRYSKLENFYQLSNNISYEPGYLLSGNLTENGSGKKVFVVLFKKGKDNWTEFVFPDRASFVQAFGIDKADIYFSDWEPLVKLSGYNRFGVAASDLKGKWTTSFSGIQHYYNIYTGASAGATSYSSVQTYDFTGSAYQWEIKVASGQVGNARFQNAKSKGTFTVPGNWLVTCSDIEGKAKKYDAYFSFIKGGRILWLSDTAYPGYTSFYKAN